MITAADRMSRRSWTWRLASSAIGFALACAVVPGVARADTVGTTFPADFPVIIDASLGVPVIGFGAGGPVRRTPVIFLHGNNDTPFPTSCNPFFGRVHDLAQFFADQGYSASELWGLGYQGDQCDLIGILSSPDTREIAFDFVRKGSRQR